MVANTDKKGAWAEHIAAAHFLANGWFVFRSCSPGSPIDLVIIKDAKVRFLDVKYRRPHKPSGRKMNERQIALGVEMIHVMASGKVIDRADSSN